MRTDADPRPPRTAAAVAGVAVAGLALGIAELVAGVHPSWRSPVLDVGDRVVDAAPPALKELAIETFGTNDKVALLVGIGTLLAAYAGVVGTVALRRRLGVGLAGVALFGAVGAWAASGRRAGAPWHVVAPSALGALAGMAALWGVDRLGGRPAAEARRAPWPAQVARGGAAPTAAVGEARRGPSGGGRRWFLSRAGALIGGLGAVAVAAGATGRRLGSRFTAGESRAAVRLPPPADPRPAVPAGARVDVAGMTPFFTPNADFYRIDTALTAPQVRTDDYRLRVTGRVDRVLDLSYDDLLDRPMVERDITLTCVSNEVGGRYVGNARWLGARLDDLLREAGVQPGADQVVGRSVDGYACGFPVADALDGRDALVAVAMNGEPLPIEHGFPARLVVPGLYGYVSATKWLTEIELTTFADFDHYWLRRGWAQRAPIKLMSRIDTPRGLARVAAGTVPVAGVAWAQTVGIAAVDLRIDDGPWQRARLADAPSADTWRQWVHAWDATPGRHALTVRAVDADGAIQTDRRAEPIPDGASGHHQIVVIVE